ncbi:MAG: fasciclin domain-containing protein [Isosphaeraceae bacterium]
MKTRLTMIGIPAAVLFLSLATVSQADDDSCPVQARSQARGNAASGERSVLKSLAASGKARTLLAALVASDLLDRLRGDGPFTIFAPTDDAFGKLPEGALESLLEPENKAKLVDVLSYHVVPGRYPASALASSPRLKTLGGGSLTIAANGRGVAVDGATVVRADLVGRNGVVHLIDRVLTPPADDILATAEKAGSFTTLRKALKAAGLEDALGGDGPFTVFAPTDEAFAKLGGEKLKALLKPSNRHLLAAVLKYHVVSGKVTARDAVTAGSAATLQGGKVTAGIKDGRLVINDARVIGSDIEARNGIIHAIDSVLIPGGDR